MDYKKIQDIKKWHQENITKIGIPNRFINCDKSTIEKYIWNKALLAINNNNGLYIYGPVGTGKTYLACTILKEKLLEYKPYLINIGLNIKNNSQNMPELTTILHEEIIEKIQVPDGGSITKMKEADIAEDLGLVFVQPLINIDFVGFNTLLRKIKGTFTMKESTYDENIENESSIVANYSDCLILCIDDLDIEKLSDWSKNILYEIIENRYCNKLITIITTNYNHKELAKKYSDKIVSRLCEMCEPIKLAGTDRRLSKYQKKAAAKKNK
ncbi:MAG: hypothetical protein A2Y62_04730 [Candidatus Fischerbacteria bacterium RBG_13_37_8]|uniref:Uncharacterized protein n=1 Tax=Candidatus Fischerbacteria bacterium RBG_13_37_8 TaxID=1817863 RepID=A0A1F5VUR2_9BACT|nr:MAG: hypothetical protein A2Y62_04730 [Candidatus Fischerbacteria bacterium RBG_13_37_8]